jgi:hypothetical protein
MDQTLGASVGEADGFGWYGFVRHYDRPGALILRQDEQCRRYVWETDSDERAVQQWQAIWQNYLQYWEANPERRPSRRDAPHPPMVGHTMARRRKM